MAAAPVPEPTNKNADSSVYDLFYRLIVKSPPWVRIVVVLLLAGGIALSLSGKIPDLFGKTKKADTPSAAAQVQNPISIQIQNGPYPTPAGSKQVDGPGNANYAPQNLDATHHFDEDAEHYKFHQEHPEDNPELTQIAKFDDKNDISYKFYGKTDKCVFVLRHENGVPISQFVKDPAFRDGVAQPPRLASVRGSSNSANASVRAGLFDDLIPSAAAAQLEFPKGMDESHLRSVQAGCAVGQHPGPFNWWWGPPQDQCWSPMFRQWRDGCTHYQMFNRCANAWDGRIVWTACNPNHYW
jgi:hypothetical protein